MRQLKCTECNKKCDVGEQTTAIVCENCTSKGYNQWLQNELKKQNENEK